jgi:predicted ABC-type ATPase
VTEAEIQEAAIAFARAHKKDIARRITDTSIFKREADPVSVFMAGSPGAGKTEASIELLARFPTPVLRIDPDELRSEFPDYTGGNAALFQPAVSILVDRIHDLALEQDQSFILDGTLSHHAAAHKNVQRSLKRGRAVQILYVYQSPLLAWDFVQAREGLEGRRIRAEVFVEQYFAARDVVNALKHEFGPKVSVDLLMKNNDNSNRFYRAGVDQVDHHIPETTTREELERQLGLK